MDITIEQLKPESKKYLNEWVNYVADFYHPKNVNVLYPIKGLTIEKIRNVVFILLGNGKLNNGIDSLDREMIRDILLLNN